MDSISYRVVSEHGQYHLRQLRNSVDVNREEEGSKNVLSATDTQQNHATAFTASRSVKISNGFVANQSEYTVQQTKYKLHTQQQLAK